MPPWQGGGEMIEHVSFSGTRFNRLPFKFEAGTPNIAGAIGLGKALEFLADIDVAAMQAHEHQLRQLVEEGLSQISGIRLIGQAEWKAPVVSFVSGELHNQDIGLMLDQQGIAVRTGHHCAMPLMEGLDLNGTVRASFALYNTIDEAMAFVDAMDKLHHSPLYIAHPEMNSDQTQTMISETTDLPEIFRQQAPNLATITERLNGLSGWQERYRQIMLLGKELPVLSGNGEMMMPDFMVARAASGCIITMTMKPCGFTLLLTPMRE